MVLKCTTINPKLKKRERKELPIKVNNLNNSRLNFQDMEAKDKMMIRSICQTKVRTMMKRKRKKMIWEELAWLLKK